MTKRHIVYKENVLIRMIKAEKVSSGGIVYDIDSRAKEGSEEAIIEQMGSDAFSDYDDHEKFNVGDKILIARYSGKSVGEYEDKQERRIIVDTGVLAKILEE